MLAWLTLIGVSALVLGLPIVGAWREGLLR